MRRRPLEPYRALLAGNPEFRRLWIGQLISQLGDWFSSIAIYSLLIERTGSGEAVALAMLAQFLPLFLIGPPAGVLADRIDRRRILIATDILRAAVVACLILAERQSGVGLVYGLLIGQVVLSAFFEPARAAMVPTVTKRSDWLVANTLAGMTWSVMLALGAGLGGGVSALLGRSAAFGIDSLTFLASAAVLWRLRPQPPDPGRERGLAAPAREFREGISYLARNQGLAVILSVKALWGVGGGILLLYTVFGERIFPLGKGAAASIGLLYAVRGVGAAVGPILGRALLGSSPEKLRRNIALSFFLGGASYLAFSQAPSLPLALLAAFLSHVGGSMMWVFSTTLLQLACPEKLRGRIFAVEMAGVTLTMSVSSYLTGVAMDRWEIEPRTLAALLGAYLFLPGAVWGWLVRKSGRTFEGTVLPEEPAVHPEEPILPVTAGGE